MIEEFLERTKNITLEDNKSIDVLLRHTISELGEFSDARSVELGEKIKILNESSKEEAVDCIICALSLFYSSGGTTNDLITIGNKKLTKWENNNKGKL